MPKTEPLLKKKLQIMKALQPQILCPECGTLRKISKEEADGFLAVDRFNHVSGAGGGIECKNCHVLFGCYFRKKPPEPFVVLELETALRDPAKYFKVEIDKAHSTAYDSNLTQNPESLSNEQIEAIMNFHSKKTNRKSVLLFARSIKELYRRGILQSSEEPKKPSGILQKIRGAFL